MSFTGIIDHQALLVLLNIQGSDESGQFVRRQQIGRVSWPVRASARDDVEVRACECLVYQSASRTQQTSEDREQRSIQEAHADDRIDAGIAKRKSRGIGHDADYSRMTRNSRGNRTMDEVDYDDSSISFRERHRVTPGAAGDVDDQAVRRKREASIDHPRRWRAIRLASPFRISRVPIRAVAARVLRVGHR